MIRINQIKCEISQKETALKGQIRKMLHLSEQQDFTYEIVKKSIDARKKPQIFYVYSVDVCINAYDWSKEEKLVKRCKNNQITQIKKITYQFPKTGEERLKHRPIIVGAGPAGLFAAYQLTMAGYAPIVIERGKCVTDRTLDVKRFWESGILNPDSNVQFGEGGAGTFSDGKLNSVVKDSTGRNRFVLETFVRYGAPSQILYDNKPHIGTDVLKNVIYEMRKQLQEKGADFYFETKLTDLKLEKNRIVGIKTDKGDFNCEVLILALGHSARDTFEQLKKRQVPMEAKNFAVGFRVEHPQSMINEALYGTKEPDLPAAPYKVTANFPNNRGVYSFCMCPGGFVVNASSEENASCVNGMSYAARACENANSAIIVSVGVDDFLEENPLPAHDPLIGMYYQRALEKKNYRLGQGRIPQQLFGDYLDNKCSRSYGDFETKTKGHTTFANLRGLMSLDMEQSFMAGMNHFAKMIPHFDRRDAILSGMETRTSSPVRILRDACGESEVKGLFPCGEGAGYAGGIMSAAIDGLKIASYVMERFMPL